MSPDPLHSVIVIHSEDGDIRANHRVLSDGYAAMGKESAVPIDRHILSQMDIFRMLDEERPPKADFTGKVHSPLLECDLRLVDVSQEKEKQAFYHNEVPERLGHMNNPNANLPSRFRRADDLLRWITPLDFVPEAVYLDIR